MYNVIDIGPVAHLEHALVILSHIQTVDTAILDIGLHAVRKIAKKRANWQICS